MMISYQHLSSVLIHPACGCSHQRLCHQGRRLWPPRRRGGLAWTSCFGFRLLAIAQKNVTTNVFQLCFHRVHSTSTHFASSLHIISLFGCSGLFFQYRNVGLKISFSFSLSEGPSVVQGGWVGIEYPNG